MTYKGIDYGMGQSNVNHTTGIRFGVINQNGDILQAWADESEMSYPDLECPECGSLNVDDDEGKCLDCEAEFDTDCAYDCVEPIGAFYVREGYKAHCGESGDIFVEKAPYFTYAQFCSPCAPGACHLESPLEDPNPEEDSNNRAYCFGHDWFEGGKAPYPVFDVETGTKVLPPESTIEISNCDCCDRKHTPVDSDGLCSECRR